MSTTPWVFLAVFVLVPALLVALAVYALDAHLFVILAAFVWAGLGLTLASGAMTGDAP